MCYFHIRQNHLVSHVEPTFQHMQRWKGSPQQYVTFKALIVDTISKQMSETIK